MNNKTYFCSDTHLFHNNVLKFDKERWNRFTNIYSHNDYIAHEIQSLWENCDLYILWDLVWKMDLQSEMWMHERFFKNIKCKLHRILWNHDYSKIVDKYKQYFETITPYHEWKYQWIKFILFHYPILSWNWWMKRSIHIHWHDHRHSTLVEWNRFNIAYNWFQLLYNIEDFLNWKAKEIETIISTQTNE